MKVVLYFKKLNIGGAERSTVRLLNALAESGNDVTLFVWTKGGALEKELSPKVNLIYFFKDSGALNGWDRTKKRLLKIKPHKLLDAAFQYVCGTMRKLMLCLKNPAFDLAITGWHGYDPKILRKYTTYKKHYQMIRNENAIAIDGIAQPFISKYKENLECLDGYICVSKYLCDMMIKYCDLDPEHVVTIYNIINIDEEYQRQTECPSEYLPFKNKDTIIATVCRLVDGPKGLFRMVSVCKKLKDKGYRFKWFVVGDGVDRERMMKAIADNGLTDTMILCGFRQNPIPYYSHADLIAVLSYVEGLCGTVNESKLLQRPLISTRFSSIDEQIQSGYNGHVVDNDEESIVSGMELLLTDSAYRESLAKNGMPEELLNNQLKVEKFQELVLEDC